MFIFQRRLKASKTQTNAHKAVGVHQQISSLVLVVTMAAVRPTHHRNVTEPVTQDVIA